MTHSYRYITIDRRGDVLCVRLRLTRFDEEQLYELTEEMLGLITREGCRKLALDLAPGAPECLYSVFLARLVTLQRVLHEHGGELALCGVSPTVWAIFEACRLDGQFVFRRDLDEALVCWQEEGRPTHETNGHAGSPVEKG